MSTATMWTKLPVISPMELLTEVLHWNTSRDGLLRAFTLNYAVNSEQCSSMDMIDRPASQIGLGSTKKHGNYQVGVIDESHLSGPNGMIFVESSSGSAEGAHLVELTGEAIDNAVDIPSYADPELTTPFYGVTSDPSPAPNSLNGDVNSFSDLDASVSEMKESFSDAIKRGENILNNSIDTITSSVNKTLINATKADDSVIKVITSFFNKSGESFGNKFTVVTSDLKGASGRARLRKAVVTVEDSLIQGGKIAGYAYNFAKEFLPPEFKETIRFSENTVIKILGPVGTAFQQGFLQGIYMVDMLEIYLRSQLWSSYKEMRMLYLLTFSQARDWNLKERDEEFEEFEGKRWHS